MRIGRWAFIAAGTVAALWLALGRRREGEGEGSMADGFAPRPTSLQALQGCLVKIEELRRQRQRGAAV